MTNRTELRDVQKTQTVQQRMADPPEIPNHTLFAAIQDYPGRLFGPGQCKNEQEYYTKGVLCTLHMHSRQSHSPDQSTRSHDGCFPPSPRKVRQ